MLDLLLRLFSFIDRSNIGNAKLAGLDSDLGISTGTAFNTALLVFYIPYILVDVPSNLLLKRVRAGVYLPSLITAWGLVCTFTGFTKSFAGLVVCRLLLGLFEGGILGGVIIYLAMFYRRHEMLYRSGLFYCAAPLSGAFGGLLASALGTVEAGGYRGWPWIFFVEGAVTVVFGILCFFFMPDTPALATFLTAEEKEWALRRMQKDASGSTTVDVDNEKFDWGWVMMALKAPQMYLCAAIWFFLLISLYSFSLFLPSIISGMGYTSTIAQLLTAPPNMAGFVTVILTAYFSDKLKNRGGFIAVGIIVGICGYIMLLVSDQDPVKYAGTFLIAVGVFQASPMLMGWVSNNLAPHYVRAVGVGLVISIANCSAFIGTFVYLQRDA
ncbi:High-affinity nicotinic acid transporter [Madurella mycetomatis]|uniref:High-affinity nicotinic acid transporter n=1 Tax=Madurella mycetomatis TaxID=100816 RepID=A0A175WGZ0_9PEZI|nr:High-affinity nicotinic acid transporter [Madurella mycetomatis]